MTTDIKRYAYAPWNGAPIPTQSGDYVLHADHLAALHSRDERIAELERELAVIARDIRAFLGVTK